MVHQVLHIVANHHTALSMGYKHSRKHVDQVNGLASSTLNWWPGKSNIDSLRGLRFDVVIIEPDVYGLTDLERRVLCSWFDRDGCKWVEL